MNKTISRILLALLLIFVLALVGVSLTGCQSNAKHFGGTAEITLPEDHKLLEITWKDDSLWYLVRPMHPEDIAETYLFEESNDWGVMEGTVIIRETKSE